MLLAIFSVKKNEFTRSHQVIHKELRQAMLDNNGQLEPEMHLLFQLKNGIDARRYNFQGVFTTTAYGDIPESYVTIHNKDTNELQYLSSIDPNVELWIFPLFYPSGTQG